MIRELAIVSGKGGTGKTSIAASFAVLAKNSVVVDCDVDAADLHLVLGPVVKERHRFLSGREATIREADCRRSGKCAELCRFDAVHIGTASNRSPSFRIDPLACEGCGVCVRHCPHGAIDFPERDCGEWMISETRCGPMVHARLGIAAESSGKLVTTIRREARRLAAERGLSLILADGPPGIGCPVIASVTGATQVLVVTEPSVSGLHDLERILCLTSHFEIPTAVCVNKWDIHPEMAGQLEEAARRQRATIAGRVRYDREVTAAQMQSRAVVERTSPVADDVRRTWEALWNR